MIKSCKSLEEPEMDLSNTRCSVNPQILHMVPEALAPDIWQPEVLGWAGSLLGMELFSKASKEPPL